MKASARSKIANRLPYVIILVCLVVIVVGISVLVFRPIAPSGLLAGSNSSNEKYSGIGKFFGSDECSAVFIDLPYTQAYILTSGHCASAENFDEPVVNKIRNDYYVMFNFFFDVGNRHVRANSRRIVKATMDGTDLALIELEETKEQLINRRIYPIRIANGATAPVEINVVGVPLQPLPAYVRLSKCTGQEFVTVAEDRWQFRDVLAMNCKGITNGSSGSAVLSDSNELIALLNTGVITEPVQDRECELNFPCELTNEGFMLKQGRQYAPQVKAFVEELKSSLP